MLCHTPFDTGGRSLWVFACPVVAQASRIYRAALPMCVWEAQEQSNPARPPSRAVFGSCEELANREVAPRGTRAARAGCLLVQSGRRRTCSPRSRARSLVIVALLGRTCLLSKSVKLRPVAPTMAPEDDNPASTGLCPVVTDHHMPGNHGKVLVMV